MAGGVLGIGRGPKLAAHVRRTLRYARNGSDVPVRPFALAGGNSSASERNADARHEVAGARAESQSLGLRETRI